MNNLSSYCGLVDAKIRASDKDLPVLMTAVFHTFRRLFGIVMYDYLLPLIIASLHHVCDVLV